MIDLSILIISHGHEDDVPCCIDSLAAPLHELTHEFIVIDNLGNGLLAARLGDRPHLKLLENSRPLGFSANVNRGARAAAGRHLLVLNPDTTYQSGSFKDALTFLAAHPRIGLLGARLLNPDGRVQESARRFPTAIFLLLRGLGAETWRRVPRAYSERLLDDPSPDAPLRVDWVFGAFMLMPRAAFDAVGGMDEKYRLYYEDVDLNLRLRRAGFETWLYPGLAIVHAHRRESARTILSRHRLWHVRSALRYFRTSGSFLRPPALP